MKRKRALLIFLSLLLILPLRITYSEPIVEPFDITATSYVDHVPIVIINDQNFTDYGFPGIGTKEDPQEICFGGAGLELLPRNMAKLGYLFLNNGTWNDTQIVSEEWVSQASEGKIYLSYRTDYGYQWWVYPLINAYLALGWGGQIIMVIPEHDIVVVFTSSLDESEFPFREIVAEYIIKASEEGYVKATSITLSSVILSLSISTLVIVFKKKQRS